MATVTALNTDSAASTAGTGVVTMFSDNREVLLERVIDFNKSSTNIGTTDVVEVFTLPAGCVINWTGVQVLTADTAGNSGTIIVKQDSTSRGSATAPTPVGYPANLFSATVAQVGTSVSKITLTCATGAINAVVRVMASIQPVTTKKTYVAGYMSSATAASWEMITP